MTTQQEELYNRVIEHILEEPKRIDMCDWVVPQSCVKGGRLPECGTVACFAGWTVAIANNWDYETLIQKRFSISSMAEEALGITRQQAVTLFGAWPSDWLDKLYQHGVGTKAYAQVVASFARHYLKQIKKEQESAT